MEIPMTRHRNAGFIFLYVPWWLNIVLAAVCYGAIAYGLPMLADDGPVIASIARGLRPLAPYLAIFFLALAAVGIVAELRRLRQVAADQTDPTKLCSLSYENMQSALIAALQRRNFSVQVADGGDGVDLLLHAGNGDLWIVNFRNWQVAVIDAPAIGKLFGVMAAKGAVACVFLTSGGFTVEAVRFANGQPIHLVDGPQLLDMLQSPAEPVAAAAA